MDANQPVNKHDTTPGWGLVQWRIRGVGNTKNNNTEKIETENAEETTWNLLQHLRHCWLKGN